VSEGRTLPPTKRSILKICAKIYDPIGLLSPISMQIKMLFQTICHDKYLWDTILPQEIINIWTQLLQNLANVGKFSLHRHMFDNLSEPIKDVEIHGFCDSSLKGYCAFVYLRVSEGDKFFVKLLSGKSKVAPLKGFQIPRLELLGCHLLSKLVLSVRKAVGNVFNVVRECYWTDSEISLCWINGIEKEWATWVENRVNVIRKNCEVGSWFFVPGKLNPADIGTRIFDFSSIGGNGLYWEGPEFLRFNETSWPSQKYSVDENKLECFTLITTENTTVMNLPCIANLIDIEKFSSLKKLLHVTCYILRFTSKLLAKIRNKRFDNEKVITIDELEKSKYLWILNEQSKFQRSSKFKETKLSLNLFSDENSLLRMKGRFANCNLDYNFIYPIFIPKDSYLTKLIILDSHERVLHAGLAITLNFIRNTYWITQGRRTVKMILDRCVTCKRAQALPLRGPPPPDLPSFRMSFDFAFSNTGIDFAGPLYVRNIYGDSNTMYKSYICLFTCATTRNIHLELTPDMTTHSLINSLERFLSRRGCINMFISDNFTSFKSGDLLNFLKDNEIKWKYILPLSPWWGGFYERLVRIVKTTLRKILGSARLHFEELSTILTKVEAMINSRPLSYLYDDDPETAITPSHLSIGRNIYSNKPTMEVTNETFSISQTEASKRIQYIEKVLQTYWTRFKKEYLNELREHQIYDRRKYKAILIFFKLTILFLSKTTITSHEIDGKRDLSRSWLKVMTNILEEQ